MSGPLATGNSGGGGGVTDAQYVVLAVDATLTDERVLTGTANEIVLTDGGAGGAATLSAGTLIVQTDQANTWTVGGQQIQTGAAGTIGLIIEGAAGQTANLQEWKDSAAAVVVYVDDSGNMDVAGHLAIGASANVLSNAALNIQDATIDSDTSTYGLYMDIKKIAGASDTADLFQGVYLRSWLNQAEGTVGHSRGINGTFRLDAGDVGSAGTTRSAWGTYFLLDLNGGTIHDDAIGHLSFVDQEAGNTVSGDIVGILSMVDADGTVTGSVYGVRVTALSNMDWAYYCSQDVPSALRGELIVGNTGAPGAQIHIDVPSNTTIGAIIEGAASQSADLQQWQDSGGTELMGVEASGELDFRWGMGDSTKDPTADAPADWVQVKIGGTSYYLPAYAAS